MGAHFPTLNSEVAVETEHPETLRKFVFEQPHVNGGALQLFAVFRAAPVDVV
jgi:hypothetical protein